MSPVIPAGASGHRVLIVDTKIFNPNRYLPVAVRHAFAGDPRVGAAVLANYRTAIAAADALRPTILLLFGGEEIDHCIVRKLVRRSGRSAIWFTEDPYELTRNQQSATLVDTVFTNDRGSAGHYKNAHYLPLAGFAPFHQPPTRPDGRRYDLFFAGTAWPNRVDMFQRLFAMNPDLRLKLFVPPSPFGSLGAEVSAHYAVQTVHVSGMDFARFSARSATTLYLTRDFSLSPGSPSLTASPGPRFFEAAMAGGVQIYPHGTIDLPEGFADGETAFCYHSLDEMEGLVRRFRDDRQGWAATAERCRRLIAERHTYGHRVATLLDILR